MLAGELVTYRRPSGGESVTEDVIEYDRGRGTWVSCWKVGGVVMGCEDGGVSRPASASQLGRSLTYGAGAGGVAFFAMLRGRIGAEEEVAATA